jgi:hypothetical protein
MKLESVPVRTAGIVSQLISSEAVLVDPSHNMVRVLNPVGARVWEAVDGQLSIREVAAQVAADFNVSFEQVAPDVLRFCEDLAARGLLTARTPE